MAIGTISLEGAKELIAKLERFTPTVGKQIMRTALRAGAQPILAQARANAPGARIKRSLKVRAGKSSKAGQNAVSVLVSTRAGDFKGKEFFAGFLEYGTKERTQKKFKKKARRTGKVSPREFMKRAFESRQSEAERIIAEELKAGIEAELVK